MSYFMTTAGPSVDLTGLEPIELLRAAEAQEYLRGLASEISQRDGAPLFMVHDGRTGTSHDLVEDACNAISDGQSVESTQLFQVLERLASAGHTVRIWWADDSPAAWLRVEECHSLAEAAEAIRKQVDGTIALRAIMK